ncbi:MAG TPA: Uma2 family endonuclease [Isosphaeraceae bacterium]|jgi:Uma2 family endonuclease
MSSARSTAPRPATIDDLLKVEGKAELIDGRIVRFMPVGHEPNQIAGEIFLSLKMYIRATGRGFAYTDSMGFAVPKLRSGRQSFSPDTSYYDGPPPANPMKFVDGPPTFAVEVRSENGYGPAAEKDMAAKRADYFEAGTLVVWDVDPRDGVIRAYKAGEPTPMIVFAEGDVADAEPAVPGWRMPVSEIFG